MATFISHSPEETEAAGEAWGLAARPGWVIGLRGDLGAGKTCLVRGLARGLQITARVRSPTFSLVNEYRGGRLPLDHLDLYRLESRREILSAGLDNYFLSPEGVVVVEWIDRWLDLAPPEIPSPGWPARSPQVCPISVFSLQHLAFPQGFPARYRHVCLEPLDETRRGITYEDFGD
jgi:tRNA threonylcarbamoyladenosine biosynthesis protein TsaE